MPSLNPYLPFQGNAREALEFYQSVFGGDLDIMTFEGFADQVEEDEVHLVMHAQLTTPDGFVLMGSDNPSHVEYVAPAGISLSLSGSDEAKFRGFWDALAEGGTLTLPLDSPPWGGLFGMLVDKFGFSWMVSVSPEQ